MQDALFYILQSSKDQKYYYGSTSNLKRRFNEHQCGNVASTKFRRPLNLIYYEVYLSKEQAVERETIVKRSISARRALHKRI